MVAGTYWGQAVERAHRTGDGHATSEGIVTPTTGPPEKVLAEKVPPEMVLSEKVLSEDAVRPSATLPGV